MGQTEGSNKCHHLSPVSLQDQKVIYAKQNELRADRALLKKYLDGYPTELCTLFDKVRG